MKNKSGHEIQSFMGTFACEGVKDGFLDYLEPAILLVNLRDEYDLLIAPYAWINLTPTFKKLDLKIGDQVSFNATKVPFNEGFGSSPHYIEVPHLLDFKLNNPRKIEVFDSTNGVSPLNGFEKFLLSKLKTEGRKNDE